jgi:anti-sigma regulatory factor (Ser/Thr protein kinase)
VERETAGPVWPSATPPRVAAPDRARALRWELHDVAELAVVRAELRQHTAAPPGARRERAEIRDQLILALDEMASNALRHGGGRRVVAAVQETEDAYLIDVADSAPATPPTPAVDRDPSEGGLGLYLIAELASDHGWYVQGGTKHVWALLPRS